MEPTPFGRLTPACGSPRGGGIVAPRGSFGALAGAERGGLPAKLAQSLGESDGSAERPV